LCIIANNYKLLYLGIDNKNKKLIIRLFKIVVLIIAYTYIYYKFKNIEFNSILEFKNYSYLIISILLMPINWFIESKKWQLLISKYEGISIYSSYKAILSGLTTSIFTPNRVGEFVGRIMFVSEENRIKATVSTVIGSYSQVLITIIIGALSVFFIKPGQVNFIDNHIYIKWLFVIVAIVFVLIFFNINKFSGLFKKINNKYVNSIASTIVSYSFSDLLKVFALSFLRYLIFFIQFYLLLMFFNVEITVYQSFVTVGVFYLLLMFIPTFVISEPGVRISTAMIVFSFFVTDISLVVYTVSLLWLINIVLPTVFGTIFFIKQKF